MTSAAAQRPEPVGRLAERVRADGTRFLLAVFVDVVGKPAAKLIPAEAVERFEKEGANFAGPAAVRER